MSLDVLSAVNRAFPNTATEANRTVQTANGLSLVIEGRPSAEVIEQVTRTLRIAQRNHIEKSGQEIDIPPTLITDRISVREREVGFTIPVIGKKVVIGRMETIRAGEYYNSPETGENAIIVSDGSLQAVVKRGAFPDLPTAAAHVADCEFRHHARFETGRAKRNSLLEELLTHPQQGGRLIIE